MKKINSRKGYTLLFATLTAAVVLGVAIFITSTSRKQFILSSTARDSLFSIYNADSALECAVVGWETDGFAEPATFRCNGDNLFSSGNFNSISSGELPVGWSSGFKSPDVIVSFNSGSDEKGCAVVNFLKGTNAGGEVYSIESRGYNLGNSVECPKIGPRTVERALRVTYGD